MTGKSSDPSEVAIGFATRLAYIRWLRDRGRIVREPDRAFAEHMGIGEKWLVKWKFREVAPEGRSEYERLAEALAPMGVAMSWLYDGLGSAPEPRLWDSWAMHLGADPARDRPVSAERVARAIAKTKSSRATSSKSKSKRAS